MRRMLLALLLAAAPLNAWGVQPDEVLPDPALEARAREISRDLRCLVCQNQSIDDSDAGLAHDLRVLVRDRLKKGDSNTEVRDYVTARYGDYVLLRPPVKSTTYLLWAGPFLVLAAGGLGTLLYLRRRAAAGTAGDTAPLSEDERRRLDALLGKDGA